MSHENGYNMKRGGMKRCVGYKHTEEQRLKNSLAKIGSTPWKSPVTNQKTNIVGCVYTHTLYFFKDTHEKATH